MASPTQWTWFWVSSESWWWTGKPGMLQSMGSQRVRTWLNWTESHTSTSAQQKLCDTGNLNDKEIWELECLLLQFQCTGDTLQQGCRGVEWAIFTTGHSCYLVSISPFFLLKKLILFQYPLFICLNWRIQETLLLLLNVFSRVRLCATPPTAAHQAPLSLGFSRQEHWSGLPFPSPMHESEKWKWSRSVVSDPPRPHGLQSNRLLRPWDSPGKSTGVGCHCLSPF